MANELVFNPNAPAQLPAHLRHLASTVSARDLTEGVSAGFAVLKFKGKVWSVQKGDLRMVILNEDGDPRASVDLVIVRANDKISKTFYGKGFTEGDVAKPTCWSNDGKTPSTNVESPVCASCSACPNNVIGSRTGDDGTKMKACSDNRRLAVLNLSYVDPEGDAPTLQLLRLPYTSMKALAELGRQLSASGAPYNAVVVKAGFDMTKAFPLVTFQPRRYMSEEEARIAAKLSADAASLDAILGDTEFVVADTGTGADVDLADNAPSAAPKPTAPKPTAPKPTAPKPTAPKPTAPKPAAPKPAAGVDEDIPPPATRRAPETLDAAPEPAAGGDDLDALFGEFDDA